MEAAIGGRLIGLYRVHVTRLRAAACASLLAAAPCWAQDMPVVGLEFAPGAGEAAQQNPAVQLAQATIPRLALTLGTPILVPGLAAGPQQLDLGVQWRQPVLHDRHVDITAWRRMTSEPDALTLIRQRDPVYGARVEVNLQGRKRGLVADRRFIGLQLDSCARITLRRKDGNPVLYYRSQF